MIQLYYQIWDLHLRSFSLMLPYFVCYDHCNYTRWGPVYLVRCINFLQLYYQIWDLHLRSFSLMLPYFVCYDHCNYARWGPVYLAEMHQLPTAILSDFQKGNFVVKRASHKFNQVDSDQAQEWIYGAGKKAGGIVGITKTISALSRWTLSCNLASEIAVEACAMFNLNCGEVLHNEGNATRQQQDNLVKMQWLALHRGLEYLLPEVR